MLWKRCNLTTIILKSNSSPKTSMTRTVYLEENCYGYDVYTASSRLSTPITRINFNSSSKGVGNPEVYPVKKREDNLDIERITLPRVMGKEEIIDYGNTPEESQKKAYEQALEFAKKEAKLNELELEIVKEAVN